MAKLGKFNYGEYDGSISQSDVVFTDNNGYAGPTSETETRKQLSTPLAELKKFINKTVSVRSNDDTKVVQLGVSGNDIIRYRDEESGTWHDTASGGHLIYVDGSPVTQRPILEFDGAEYTDTGTKTVIKGLKGDKGDAGTSFALKGKYDTLEELQSAHPTGLAGDAYLVGTYVYVWGVDDSEWINCGELQGAKGDTGPAGPAGKGFPEGGSTGQMLAKKSNVDFDTEWRSPSYNDLTNKLVGGTGISISNNTINNVFANLASVNLNTITYNYQGYVSTPSNGNAPPKATIRNGQLVSVFSVNGNYGVQLFKGYTDVNLFSRSCNDGVWSDWKSVNDEFNAYNNSYHQVDLNTITTSGMYRVSCGSGESATYNFPRSAVTGNLMVTKYGPSGVNDYVHQIFYRISPVNEIFYRVLNIVDGAVTVHADWSRIVDGVMAGQTLTLANNYPLVSGFIKSLAPNNQLVCYVPLPRPIYANGLQFEDFKISVMTDEKTVMSSVDMKASGVKYGYTAFIDTTGQGGIRLEITPTDSSTAYANTLISKPVVVQFNKLKIKFV